MTKLTGNKHGDAANALFAFYQEKANALEEGGQFFMAAIALALALEAAVLTYLLVEFDEGDDGELKIPSSINMSALITVANEVEVLNAPIDIPSLLGDDGDETPPKYVAKEVADKIKKFRNLIHPARAIKEGFDPSTFGAEQLRELRAMYDSILHSLLYYL